MNVSKVSQTIAKKDRKVAKFKKPPNAPKRFKTAFISFSSFKHKEIREQRERETIAGRHQHSNGTKTTNIAKAISKEWKELNPDERKKWENMASKDKARWDVEKTMYGGPWKVTAKQCRKMKKDPDAPKRPMSSYLAFANSNRSEVKLQNPQMKNAELSRKLADMWKEASDEEKKQYIDEEYKLRQIYLTSIAEFKKKKKTEEDAKRTEREEYASSIASQSELSPKVDSAAMTQQVLLQNGDQKRNIKSMANVSSELVQPQADREGAITAQQQQHLLQLSSVNQSGNNAMASITAQNGNTTAQTGDQNRNTKSMSTVSSELVLPQGDQDEAMAAPQQQHLLRLRNVNQSTNNDMATISTYQATQLFHQNNQLFVPSSSTTPSVATPSAVAPQSASSNFFQTYESTSTASYQINYQNGQPVPHQPIPPSGGLYEARTYGYGSQENGTTASAPLSTVTASYCDIWNGHSLGHNDRLNF